MGWTQFGMSINNESIKKATTTAARQVEDKIKTICYVCRDTRSPNGQTMTHCRIDCPQLSH